jgi:hypothetical protein
MAAGHLRHLRHLHRATAESVTEPVPLAAPWAKATTTAAVAEVRGITERETARAFRIPIQRRSHSAEALLKHVSTAATMFVCV